jgi:hypothetical protein
VVLIKLINKIKIQPILFTKSVFVILISILLSCCGNSGIKLQQTKTVDSLQTNLLSNKKLLLQIDSVELSKAINKFEIYKQFIKSNIKDTINKTDAYAIQSFINAGNNLQSIQLNKINLITRINLLSNQLLKLGTDIKNNSFQNNQINGFIETEKLMQVEIAKFCIEEQNNYFKNLQQLKTNLYLVEQLILKRNNNQLPTVINSNPNL